MESSQLSDNKIMGNIATRGKNKAQKEPIVNDKNREINIIVKIKRESKLDSEKVESDKGKVETKCMSTESLRRLVA
jgi:hypothetical protein